MAKVVQYNYNEEGRYTGWEFVNAATTSDVINSYNDLDDRPTIPTDISDLTDTGGLLNGAGGGGLTQAQIRRLNA